MKLSIVETRGLYFINKTDNNGKELHCVWEYKWKTPHEYPPNYDARLGYHSLELAEAAYKHIKEWYEKPKFVTIKEENINVCTTLTLESAKAIVSASRGAGTTVSPELLDQALILLKESGVEND